MVRISPRHLNAGAWLAVAGLLLFAGVVVVIALRGFPSAAASAEQIATADRHDATMPRAMSVRPQRVVLGGTPAARRRAAVRNARIRAAAKAPAKRPAATAPGTAAARPSAPVKTRSAVPAKPAPAAPAPAAPAAPAPAPAAPAAPAPAQPKDPVTQVLEDTRETVQKVLPQPVQDTLHTLLDPK